MNLNGCYYCYSVNSTKNFDELENSALKKRVKSVMDEIVRKEGKPQASQSKHLDEDQKTNLKLFMMQNTNKKKSRRLKQDSLDDPINRMKRQSDLSAAKLTITWLYCRRIKTELRMRQRGNQNLRTFKNF